MPALKALGVYSVGDNFHFLTALPDIMHFLNVSPNVAFLKLDVPLAHNGLRISPALQLMKTRGNLRVLHIAERSNQLWRPIRTASRHWLERDIQGRFSM